MPALIAQMLSANAQRKCEPHFIAAQDETEVMGELFSPVVWVEIEDEVELVLALLEEVRLERHPS